MRSTPSRIRRTASLGVLLSAAALATAALSILTADVIAEIRAGDGHDFNIQVAAAEVPVEWFSNSADLALAWTPEASAWQEGNPIPVEVGAPAADQQTRVYAVAVRNASPQLSSALCLSLDAAEDAPQFDDLRLTLVGTEGQLVDAQGVERPRVCSDEEITPGGTAAFALRIAGGDPAAAETFVRLRIDGAQR